MLTREQLLTSFTRRYDYVDTIVGRLRIQNLNEAETAAFQAGQVTAKGEISEAYQKIRRQRLVAACLVDDDGKKLLSQPGDAAQLANVDGAVITAVFVAALKHCGLNKLDEEDSKKNSGPAPGNDSLDG